MKKTIVAVSICVCVVGALLLAVMRSKNEAAAPIADAHESPVEPANQPSVRLGYSVPSEFAPKSPPLPLNGQAKDTEVNMAVASPVADQAQVVTYISSPAIPGHLVVSGKVLAPDGRPAESVLVALGGAMQRTDGNGEFTLDKDITVKRPHPLRLNVTAARNFYLSVDLGGAQAGESVRLDDIKLPQYHPGTGIEGTVTAAPGIMPQMLKLQSTDGTVVAFLGVRDGKFKGTGYPAMEYILSNTSALGTPLPKGAVVFKKFVTLRHDEVVTVPFSLP